MNGLYAGAGSWLTDVWTFFRDQTNILLSTFIVLTITAIILLIYTFLTGLLARRAAEQVKKVHESNVFQAIVAIAQTFNQQQMVCLRRFLIRPQGFLTHLGSFIKRSIPDAGQRQKFLKTDTEPYSFDIRRIMEEAQENGGYLDTLVQGLEHGGHVVPGATALETVEQVMLAWDLIALPYYQKITAAHTVAEAYRPVLEKLAPAICTFVAIQTRLRGEPRYKYHLRYLLMKLGILKQLGSDYELLNVTESLDEMPKSSLRNVSPALPSSTSG